MSYNDRLREASLWVRAHQTETITIPIPTEALADVLWTGAVLPDLLAAAWDEGREVGWDELEAFIESRETSTPNPYRAPLPTPDAPQAPGGAGSPRDALDA